MAPPCLRLPTPCRLSFQDQWLARRFAAKHADDARYVSAWGRWLLWDGSRWRFDTSLRVFDLASGICRVSAAEIIDPRQAGTAKALASAQTRAAVVNVAREDRRIAAEADQWDADPWLLNTPGGIVDLRRGVTVPHDPGRYMTKITAVAPAAIARYGASSSPRSPAATLACKPTCSAWQAIA